MELQGAIYGNKSFLLIFKIRRELSLMENKIGFDTKDAIMQEKVSFRYFFFKVVFDSFFFR